MRKSLHLILISISLISASCFSEAACLVPQEFIRSLFGEQFKEDLSLIEQKLIAPKMSVGHYSIDRSGIQTDNSILIGISNHKKAGTHHYYIVTKDFIFDGQPFRKLPKVRKDLTTQSPVLKNGVFFEVKLPPEALEKLQKNVLENAGPKTVSCLHDVCQVLETSDIKIGSLKANSWKRNSQSTVQDLVKGDIRYKGEKIPQENIALYANSQAELQRIFTYPSIGDQSVRGAVVWQMIKWPLAGVISGATGLVVKSAISGKVEEVKAEQAEMEKSSKKEAFSHPHSRELPLPK